MNKTIEKDWSWKALSGSISTQHDGLESSFANVYVSRQESD